MGRDKDDGARRKDKQPLKEPPAKKRKTRTEREVERAFRPSISKSRGGLVVFALAIHLAKTRLAPLDLRRPHLLALPLHTRPAPSVRHLVVSRASGEV